ncbi:MAG: methyltransferase domain-containing protein [Acidimicrobiales bacterium]|nr:methyltransferase domain-containing protein [Acidimicrobiales bacterium]
MDPRWAERVVADAEVSPGDLVLDLGAGTGALTAPLVAAGARVIAVEMHPGRLEALRRRFGDDPVTIVRADLADLRLPRRPFRVVASPPYGATTAVLSRLLSRGSRLVRADLVVERGAARRWVEGRAPGAGRWSRGHQLELGRRVPRSAFRPPPRVDSVVLRITRR